MTLAHTATDSPTESHISSVVRVRIETEPNSVVHTSPETLDEDGVPSLTYRSTPRFLR